MNNHIPVLLNETINGLDIKKDGIYVDLTLGRGGHSKEILKRLDKGRLIAVDQDENAIEESKENLKQYLDRVTIVRDNFKNIKKILGNLNIDKVDGILMDLGVSSPQFDNPDRGFSYRFDGPLDMRMDKDNCLNAYDVVNNYSLEKLNTIFKIYGDEKYSYQIAKNIVKERQIKPINTTFELVDIIKKSLPYKQLSKKGHPAKQIFQAIRIEVNDELNVLKKALIDCLDLLNKHGRIACITFHSGEDKIVKTIFNNKTKIIGNRLNIPDTNKKIDFALINRHPIIASEEEIKQNPRSKSAKLRIIEKLWYKTKGAKENDKRQIS